MTTLPQPGVPPATRNCVTAVLLDIWRSFQVQCRCPWPRRRNGKRATERREKNRGSARTAAEVQAPPVECEGRRRSCDLQDAGGSQSAIPMESKVPGYGMPPCNAGSVPRLTVVIRPGYAITEFPRRDSRSARPQATLRFVEAPCFRRTAILGLAGFAGLGGSQLTAWTSGRAHGERVTAWFI